MKRPKRLLIEIPEAQKPLLFAACASLSCRPDELVVPALRLFCTYVLNEWTPEVRRVLNKKGVTPPCQPESIVKILASKFASKKRLRSASPASPKPKA